MKWAYVFLCWVLYLLASCATVWADGRPTVAIEGIVVDEQGKTIAGAEVAVVVRDYDRRPLAQDVLLGETKSDQNGAFRLNVHHVPTNHPPGRFLLSSILAVAPAYGEHRQVFDLKDTQKVITIRLPKEQSPIGGLLLDGKGNPAVGIGVHLRSVRSWNRPSGCIDCPDVETRAWPQSVTTDEHGRFAFHNIGCDCPAPLSMQIEVDAPTGNPTTTCITAATDPSAQINIEIVPVVKGAVTCQDTGHPLVNATILVTDTQADGLGVVLGGWARVLERPQMRRGDFRCGIATLSRQSLG